MEDAGGRRTSTGGITAGRLAAMNMLATNPPQEANRRAVVRLVYVMFWMLIVEGSIRKWAVPQFSAYVYFMRDPVCLLAYFYALRGGYFSPVHPLLGFGLGIAAVASAFSIAYLVVGDSQYTPILAAYGFRNYFFYLPLAFVIARTFRYDDIRRIAMFSMLAICIATPIAILQSTSPPNSVLNAGSSADPDFQFHNLAISGERVRPAGTFTSVMGMTQLSVCTVALVMWAWSSSRRPRPVNIWIVRVALIALAASIAISGSRTAFVHASLVIGVGVVIAPFLRGAANKIKTLVLPLVAVFLFAILFPLVFPDALDAFVARWNNAAATESRFALGWFGRAFHGFYDFSRLFDDMPLFGHGIGTAGNGAVNMGVKFNGVSVLKLAEEDWSRHVIELGPVLGLVFILFRASFGIWLGLRALRSAIAAADPLPALLFAFCSVALVHGQITGHGLVNGFGWMFAGVCMASCVALQNPVVESQRAMPPSVPERSGALSPFPNLMS
jgi:hypothetical protein